MNIISLFKVMGKNDLKLVRRDNLLFLMVVLPFVYAFTLRWAVPPITSALADKVDLTLYYPLIVSYLLICVPPILFGMVIGFLLLDERDDDTLSALRVTPIPMNIYLFYRIMFPSVICIILTMLIVPIAQLTTTPASRLWLITLLASTEAPIFALCMVPIAKNKVQGFAIMKGMGTIIALPLVAYFISPGYQMLIWIIPNFWPMKLFWIATGNQSYFVNYFIGGVIVHASINLYLLRRFNKHFNT